MSRFHSPSRGLLVSMLLLSACSDPPAPLSPSVVPAPAPEEMVLIPAGSFVMGSKKTDTQGLQQEFGFVHPLFVDEHPPHNVDLPAFYIDKYEVNNRQYKRFIEETGTPEPSPWVQNGYNVRPGKLESFDLPTLQRVARDYFKIDQDPAVLSRSALLQILQNIQKARDKRPVTAVSWDHAYTFCRWIGKRLPTEAEWERAARGAAGQEYPWGNAWDDHAANTGVEATGEEVLVPGGHYPRDRSPEGVYDLGGNVSEWVEDWYRPYPGATYRAPFYGDIHKVIRGGGAGAGHYALSWFFRSARRGHAEPGTVSTDVGFRCARNA